MRRPWKERNPMPSRQTVPMNGVSVASSAADADDSVATLAAAVTAGDGLPPRTNRNSTPSMRKERNPMPSRQTVPKSGVSVASSAADADDSVAALGAAVTAGDGLPSRTNRNSTPSNRKE